MKKFFAVLALCAMVLSAVPASGQESKLPRVAVEVIRNRDFFIKPWILWGYENCFLHDVNRLNEGRIGVILLSPSGFEIQVLYDVETLDAVYTDMRVSEKSKREIMRRKSLLVSDAVKLAKSAMGEESN
jgi:hypothetical protein